MCHITPPVYFALVFLPEMPIDIILPLANPAIGTAAHIGRNAKPVCNPLVLNQNMPIGVAGCPRTFAANRTRFSFAVSSLAYTWIRFNQSRKRRNY
jgi:hypothetical protein